MSKEIDFEFGRSIGATHYLPETDYFSEGWARIFGVEMVVTVLGEAWVSPQPHDDRIPMKIPAPSAEPAFSHCFVAGGGAGGSIGHLAQAEPWSIHNNDKLTSQLTDEQYGKMRRAEDAGGVVEIYSGNSWVVAKFCLWMPKSIYRIRPKSERDEFAEKCMAVAGQEPMITGMGFKEAYFKLFDSGCRFVEESK